MFLGFRGLCTRVSLVLALGQRAGFEITVAGPGFAAHRLSRRPTCGCAWPAGEPTSGEALVDELMAICAHRTSGGRPRPGWLGAS